MRSNNKNKLMAVNRFLANPLVITLKLMLVDVIFIALGNYIITSIGNVGEYMNDSGNPMQYFGLENCIPKYSSYSSSQKLLFILLILAAACIDIIDVYKTRIAFAEKDINQGQHGTRRWTTMKEIKAQFKAVPLKTEGFIGKPGFPISRIKDKIYIDDTLTNCLSLGSTRSGKGQGSIIQDVDIASRPINISDRPSLIIADPKTENSRMMARRLEDRGYVTRFFNLDEPSKSMGYNPLKMVVDYYKQGQNQKAQMAAKSFSFSIFNASDNVGQEPIWKNTATDLFTALQIAITSDCVEADKKINMGRKELFRQKRKEFSLLPEDDKRTAREMYFKALSDFNGRELKYIKTATVNMIKTSEYDVMSGITFSQDDEKRLSEMKKGYIDKILTRTVKEDVFYLEEKYISDISNTFGEAVNIPEREDIEDIEEKMPIDDPVSSAYIEAIPDNAAFFEIYPNEKKVNAYSCILFFQNMCNRAASKAKGGDFEEKAETAMDEYFNARSATDYARMLYLEIKSAGSKTKGSVYINMQSALSTFVLHDIAQMTAESDFDIESLGYGDKPVTIFLVIPSEDRSNYFIATTFIAQVYRYLFESAKRRTGKLERNTIFILDEFGNLPPIENFSGMVSVGLGLGIAFHIYIQSYGQIYGNYKDDAQTILDNFATQQYIMSVGNDSAEEFSKRVGTTTVISTQRSGGRFSKEKTYTESPSQRPLIYEHELAVLREGESVITRNLKRTDNLGVAIDSMPIINEYRDRLNIVNYAAIIKEIIANRFIKRKGLINPKTKAITSLSEEWKIRVNGKKRYLGTAALYAYQYLSDEFPQPETVNFHDICRESRKHINIDKRIYSAEEVLDKIREQKENESFNSLLDDLMQLLAVDEAEEKQKSSSFEKTFSELKRYDAIAHELDVRLGKFGGYEELLGISVETAVSEVKEAIENSNELSMAAKKYITSLMKEGGD